MAQFRTTKLTSHRPTDLPLFWFVQSDDEQRANTEAALDKIVEKIMTADPEIKKKKIISVPWLRNYTATAADVLATARGFEMGEGHILGIDAQGLEDGTLLVFHCLGEKQQEIGRAGREEAVRVLLKARLYTFTLTEAFRGAQWTAITIPERSLETIFEANDTVYTLPSHISGVTKLREDDIVLFSLINLTDEEMSVLKHDIGGTAAEVTIYNWPHATPASQAETYSIFQSVKPEVPVQDGQAFVMFIDAAHLSGPQRAPVVVVACESATEAARQAGKEIADDGSRLSKLEQMRYCHIYLRAEYAPVVKSLWPLIWHPPKRGYANSIAVNYPLFFGSRHRFLDPTASPATDWEHPVARFRTNLSQSRGLPLRPKGQRALKLNLAPRSAKAKCEEQEPAGEFGTRLDPLLAFFDTPSYRAVADPPSTFAFLDNEALDRLLTGASEDLSVPIATTCHYYHGEGMIAVEEPAYQFAKIMLDEGLESTLANLSVGNMWFWELVGCYSDDMDVAFWPEYRDSMTREMLDIEWDWSQARG